LERPYAFFISHVTEDAEDAKKLKAEIQGISGRGGRPAVDCFIDKHNWLAANENTAVIREFLVKSAHMLCWVTPTYLAKQRGWVWVELAYAELIELSMNLKKFAVQTPYVVPLFRGVDVQQIARTPLHDYWQRNLVLPNQDPSLAEIARKLVDYHEQELSKKEKS
jgi:hypothetical protein